MTTRADRRGNGFVINGRKHWITGGGVSRLHLIFARVFDANGEEEGIGGFIAIRDETPGLIIGKREPAMGLRGIPEAELIFEDMAVSADALVLPPHGLRRGFADLMNAYNGQRIGAATVALGLAEGAYELGLAYTKEREQFGRPICEFQGVQWMLADMTTQIAAAQALVYKAASRAGEGFPDVTEAAQAKIFASEMAIKVTYSARQAIRAIDRSNAWCGTRVCSRSGAGQRRSCAPSSRRGFLAANCPSPGMVTSGRSGKPSAGDVNGLRRLNRQELLRALSEHRGPLSIA